MDSQSMDDEIINLNPSINVIPNYDLRETNDR